MNTRDVASILSWPAILILASAMGGCGVLIGNVKPVTEKSESYTVMRLPDEDRDWKVVPQERDQDEEDPELNTSDLAYQSESTGAVVMLNSSCRPRTETEHPDLRKLTDLLILGTIEIEGRKEVNLTVDQSPALQTTLQGVLNGERVKMRTVVLRKAACVYDMMYVSRPERFEDRIKAFEGFVGSFRFR